MEIGTSPYEIIEGARTAGARGIAYEQRCCLRLNAWLAQLCASDPDCLLALSMSAAAHRGAESRALLLLHAADLPMQQTTSQVLISDISRRILYLTDGSRVAALYVRQHAFMLASM